MYRHHLQYELVREICFMRVHTDDNDSGMTLLEVVNIPAIVPPEQELFVDSIGGVIGSLTTCTGLQAIGNTHLETLNISRIHPVLPHLCYIIINC